MKTTVRVLLPFMLISGTAIAQPGTATTPPDDPSMTTPTPEVPPTPPQPPTLPQPPQPPQDTTQGPVVGAASATARPYGISLGIGIGYLIASGVNIQQPNIASVRIRMNSGLTFEPEVVFGTRRQNTDNGTTDATDSETQLTIGTGVRYPLMRRGKFDLELLGNARFNVFKDNPDGDDNGTSTTSLGFAWGLAVSYWITPHWDFTVGATNPLLSLSKTTNEMPPPASDAESTTTSIFAAFDPAVTVMMHLFY